MQTFLPYSSFQKSAECLDYKRLGKQRVEALTLLEAITSGNGWSKHPCAKMWKDYPEALIKYYNIVVTEWERRGYKNSMQKFIIAGNIKYPPFVGNEEFHNSHKSNLLRKDPQYYGKFGWDVPDDLSYVWEVE